MADGADGADAFSGLAAYARAWRVKRKMASAASAASGTTLGVPSEQLCRRRSEMSFKLSSTLTLHVKGITNEAS
jgi:hypothetical protein